VRAVVLREPGDLRIEDVTLAPPQAAEVLVRVAAAGVCHSDVHLADGSLGQARWPMVLGHEGAGTVEAVGRDVVHVAPGDRVVFCMIPSCGACSACRAGRPTLCGPAGDAGSRGTLMDGTSRLSLADGTALQHGLTVACFAERAVVAAAGVVPLPATVALWQAALLGCGAVTGIGAVRNVARPRIGESAAVVGCGGVGQQVIAGLVLSGAGAIIAVDRDPAMLELSLARGATHAVDARAGDPAAEVRALSGGGVDHAFEVVGRAETMRVAWDCLRAGGNAVVVGLAPVGVDVSFPAIEFLSDKGIKGCYYGSGNPSLELAGLVQLAADGRLQLADVVTHLTDLDGIPEGLERLRRGGGGRTVAIIDGAAAGVEARPDAARARAR
jgi:S-(hydroxymethyl)glutathione dehydrogenase / alcohol dehydrogenase